MDAVHTYAAGDEVASADLNNIQSQAASLFQVAWTWRGRRPTLACDGGNIVVGAHYGCAAGTEQSDALLIEPEALTTTAITGRSSNTWYYVYAYDNAGACAYEWSTTVPDASCSHKTTDPTRAYVGCFYALSATTARPFRMIDGRYTYRISAASTVTAYYDATAEASYTDLSLAAWMPPHTRTARLRVRLDVTTTAAWAGRTNGDTTGAWETPFVPANSSAEWLVALETDASQVIEHMSAADAAETIHMVGFDE